MGDLFVAKPVAVKGFAIERDGLDVAVDVLRVEIMCDKVERLAMTDLHGDVRQRGRADQVDGLAAVGIEADGVEEEPAGHRAGVVVAGDAGTLGSEPFFE